MEIKAKIEEIFKRGSVVDILPSKEAFVKKIISGEKIKMYYGIDPTHTSIHLGHAKNIMFLEELRLLGVEVIILFGDFTAQIGDPTDKSAARKQLTKEEVKHNMSDWVRQIKPIIGFKDKKNPAKLMYNSKWLEKLSFKDVISLASNFTVQQMVERDMFEKRIKNGTPIHLHEFFYPIMQGYDSVAMDVDAELCGTDQVFNALAGRTLLRKLKNKEKFVVVLNMIENPQTGELMSKSNGTGVFIDVEAKNLFGSIMALPDPMLEPLFLNCTRIPLNEKEEIFSKGPKSTKERLAYEIVKIYHSESDAQKAKENFSSVFSAGAIPKDAPTHKTKEGESIIESLFSAGIESKTELKRLIGAGSIKNLETDEVIKDWNEKTKKGTYKIGKHRFLKIV